MRIVPLEPEKPIARGEFTDLAQGQWKEVKAAYANAHRRLSSLFDLIHKPGQVKVYGRVTGALYEAKQLRSDVDALIVALDEIVRAGRRVEEE